MNNQVEDIEAKIDSIQDCAALKKQFAYEVFCRKGPLGMELKAKFEAAQLIARRIYPYDVTENAALYIAGEWIKDPIVIDTLLQLENGVSEGAFLPNKNQFAMAVIDLMCEIERTISTYAGSKQSPKFKSMLAMRRNCIEASELMSDVMGWKSA